MADTKLREYELVYIIQPNLDEEQIRSLDGRLAQVVERAGGRITGTEVWGQRRLAYPIKKFLEGYYILHLLELPPEAVAEIERSLRLSEDVLRYLIVRTDE